MSNIIMVKNKYDKIVALPPTHDTSMEQTIENILLKLGVSYEKQFYFDETRLRKIKYDFALMLNSKPILFIECDGESHYDPNFFLAMGNRSERNMAHVTKSILSDAVKTKLANERGIPILRINNTHDKCIQELIMSYVSVFVDDNMDTTREIQMLNMFEKYGFTFPYVAPAEPSKKVVERLKDMNLM